MDKKKVEKVVDNSLKIFFSSDKTKLYVLILVIVGLIIRLIAANNMGLSADDAIHAVRAINIIGTGIMEESGQASGLWYYVQNVFFYIFGTTQIGARAAPALFGSLMIILMFLFASYAFNSRKTGLIAAALVTFSPFLVKMTLPEMDVTVLFFIIFSGLFLFKYINEFKRKDLIISAVLIGLGILIKVYALFFVFSFSIILVYYASKKEGWGKNLIKVMFIFWAVIFVFTIPTLANNYLLYRDKGFMDLLFTNFFKIGAEKAAQYHSWGAGWMPYTDFKGFFFGNQRNWIMDYPDQKFYTLPGSIIMILLLIREDPAIMIFGILGLITLIFSKDKKYLLFFLVAFIPAFIYLESNIPMLKHFTFIPLLFAPMAALFITKISDRIKVIKPKFRLRYLILLILLFNLVWLGNGWMGVRGYVYTPSGESQLMAFTEKNIPKDALVLVDARIYRGTLGWMFNSKYYLESSLFNNAIEESNKHGSPQSTEVYFIECVSDDCGWGTMHNQPEFNKSMEQMVSWFANNSKKVKDIGAINRDIYFFPIFAEKTKEPRYAVYKATLPLSPAILPIAKSTHVITVYPLGWDESITPIFDKYTTHTPLDSLIDKIAHLIFYLSLIGVFLMIPFLLYLFIQENENP